MAKYLYGTVGINDFQDYRGSFMVLNGKLVPKTYTNQPQKASVDDMLTKPFKMVVGEPCLLEPEDVEPTHEITEIELPDGAVPLNVIAPFPDDEDGGDVLAYLIPIKDGR